MIDTRTYNNTGYRYIFVKIHNSSKYLWAMLSKNEYGQTITNAISNTSTTSKRRPLKLESDRGAEWCNSVFQIFSKVKNIQHYSRFTDRGPSIAERVIRTLRSSLKKPVFEKRNANWLSELPFFNKQYNNTIQSSVKKTPLQASEKAKEKAVYNNLKDNREVPKSKI